MTKRSVVRSAPSITIRRVVVATLAFSLAYSLAACSDEPAAGTCMDQTTYDYNWDNDMLCTRLDGSTFETDYRGAEEFESRHSP